ncbi:hypothetical protein SUGI_0766050 [Cryptomeria japonica]|nr:hypothetical protein SUGI_0766050 [Cryptomeria japonica]
MGNLQEKELINGKFEKVVKKYDLFEGKGWFGGIFPCKLLKKGPGYVNIYDAIKIGLKSNNSKFFERELGLFVEILFEVDVGWFSNSFHAILRLMSYKVHAHNFGHHFERGVERNSSKRRKIDVPLHASKEEEWKLLEEGLVIGQRGSQKESIGAKHFVTSAKLNTGIEQVFLDIATRALEKRKSIIEELPSIPQRKGMVIIDEQPGPPPQSKCS